MTKSRFLATLMVAATASVAVAPSIVFAKAHPFSEAYVSQIDSLFFEGSRLSTQKVDAYIRRLTAKRSQVRDLIQGKAAFKGKSKDSKDLDKEDSVVALSVAIDSLESAKASPNSGRQIELIQSALDLEGAVRMEGARAPLAQALSYAKQALGTWKVEKKSTASEEASNLYDPSSKSYLSVEDVAKLKARGADLSVYGPGPKSDFWVKPKSISATNMEQALLGKTLAMYEGFKGFPSSNEFEYDDMKLSSTKPKMDVVVKGRDGKKQKFKLKFGAELHADPTVSAFMMALGFPSDITTYARNVRVNLGKTKLEDVKKDWESYYLRDGNYKIEDYIASSGKDKNGDNYVVFKEASIEANPKSVKRVGGWAFADGSHSSLREVRALMMVSLWLDNSDVKEFDNNKLLLIEKEKGDSKSYEKKLIIADVGHSLGWIASEAPDLYTWKMISSNSGSSIDFKFRSPQKAEIKNKATYADARWAIRLIADLSREQIRKAVELGGWPSKVQDVYVEKMISRRNDLVTNFDLVGASSFDGKKIALLPVNDSKEDREQFKITESDDAKMMDQDFTSSFDLDVAKLIEPVADAGWEGLKTVATQAISGSKRLVLSTKRFRNFDPRFVSEILIDVRREIERNPEPTSTADTYIVRDHFEIGARLGVSFGAFKDIVYSRRYSLAYPVRSMEEGRNNNGFLVNLMLARDIAKGELPKKYVLKTEHFRSHGVGVDLLEPTGGLVRADIDAGFSKVLMWRSIIDHRNPEKYVLYRDRTSGGEKFLDVGARVLFVRLPVFREEANWGKASGKGLVFSEADLKGDKKRGSAIWKAVTEGDFQGVAKNEKLFYATNSYKGGLRKWNFLAWGESRQKRLDRVDVDADASVKSSVQYRSAKEVRFSLFGDKRQRNVVVDVYANPKNQKDFRINVGIMNLDVSTSDKDMARNIRFINSLSPDSKKLITLDTSLKYTVNGRWGSTLLKSDTEYSAEAVRKILALNSNEFYSALSAKMGKSVPTTDDEKEVIEKSGDFLKRLAEALKEKKESSRLKKLAEAFRKTIFADSTGFYNATILGVLNRVAGENSIYSRNVITVPPFSEMSLLESAPLFGEIGEPLNNDPQYLVFSPTSALELYTMFDTWF